MQRSDSFSTSNKIKSFGHIKICIRCTSDIKSGASERDCLVQYAPENCRCIGGHIRRTRESFAYWRSDIRKPLVHVQSVHFVLITITSCARWHNDILLCWQISTIIESISQSTAVLAMQQILQTTSLCMRKILRSIEEEGKKHGHLARRGYHV